MQNNNLLISLRTKDKLTQQEMAQILNVSLKTYQAYEEGIRPMKLEEINLISNRYKISLNTILDLTKSLKYYNTEINIDYKYLKFSLRYIRRMARIPINNLSKILHTSPSSIVKYEKEPTTVSITYLYNFAKYFNVSIDYMCGKTLKKEVTQ